MASKDYDICDVENSLNRALALGAYSQNFDVASTIQYLKERSEKARSNERLIDLKKIVQIFKALASPRRLELLSLLAERERCVCELQYVLGVSNPSVSQHLGVLKYAGIVSTVKRAQYTFVELELKIFLSLFEDLFDLLLQDKAP
ncbi:MAG: ArsR/SmtB family transcription factor [Candidatus Heimdallarchaeota archaeon]